ncbi:AAA family ATPase [Candidatus Thiodiazotropha sp. CDECU1]|uniref:AAA family ATPase n=1 Tax=Candidatus Thiodiazotropha sp. CDECU1 TaxID=3065865 RepID=UPI00292E7B60|nr:AAA family ATPase [Candidatus Thiodiazotropha sp. CDECU1]
MMEHSWKSSEMYESFFGFKDTPFRLSADEKFRYAHNNYLRASAHLAYALQQGEGFVMITGQPGSGKTTLIRDVISELDKAKYHCLNLVTSQLHAEELLRKVALEFGLPAETYNKATLLTNINKYLSDLHEQGKRSVLFLDEAQNLSVNGLEELRLLSNLQKGKYSLLQIVLVGHDELRRLLLGPDMEHIQQRLIANCQIEPLTPEQTREYITHRMKLVDWQDDPKIEDEIFRLFHLAAQGVPRNINHLMSHLLLFAYLEEKHQLIDEDALTVIEELIDQERITLAGEESFQNFVSKYHEQKQQVLSHAVGHQATVAIPTHEGKHWDQGQLADYNNHPRTISEKPTPANDLAPPDSDTKLESPDSEWFLWRDEDPVDIDTDITALVEDDTSDIDQLPFDEPTIESTKQDNEPALTLPNADEIWHGSMESVDMTSFFPDNQRERSSFSAEETIYQSPTHLDNSQVTEDRDHRWGGVWFMSSGKRSMPSGWNQNRNASTTTTNRLPPASILNTTHNINVDENLRIPSVLVDDCPEIILTRSEGSDHPQQTTIKKNSLLKSIMHVIIWVTVGLIAMLMMRQVPDQLKAFLHDQEPQLISPQNGTQDSPPELAPKKDPASDLSKESLTVVNEKSNMETSPLPPQAETVEVKKQKDEIEASDTLVAEESSLQVGQSDVSSYENIELATRYIVYFDFNKAAIPSEYQPLLKSIRDKMLLETSSFLKITGYADSQGNGNYNYRLSLKRAEAVKKYFTLRGIADDRFQVTAVGSVQSGSSWLESIDARKVVRRVEVILFPTQ